MKGTVESKRKYTDYKNLLTKILRIEKRNYYMNQFSLHKNDMYNTWKIIKDAMNLAKNNPGIIKIKYNNVTSEDPISVANSFNEFFSLIGENLAKNIPPSDKPFFDFLGPRNSNTLFLDPIHRNEIIDIVSNLNNKKSAGHDNINNFLLKGIITSIVDPIVYIFNLSLSSGIVPDSMKIAKVIPLFKKGDKEDINNYRPISLLSTISKVLEKIMYTRTIKFLTKYEIFSNLQFGFRKKHSTTHALLTFIKKSGVCAG